MYQVQIQHAAQKSITFQLRDSWLDFLRTLHRDDPSQPATFQQMESLLGTRLVISDRQDPDDVGFVQWRSAFYTPDADNFLLMLDAWFRFKAKQVVRDQPFQIVLYPSLGVDLMGVWNDLE